MNGWWLVAEVAVIAVVVAAIAGVIVVRRGNKQINQALATVLDLRDEEATRSNVRRLRAHEVHARIHRNNGDAS